MNSEVTFTFAFMFRSRHIIASVLLASFTLQWLGGLVYLTVSKTYEAAYIMDMKEAALSEHLQVQYQIESKVNVLNDEEMSHLMSLGYGTPFVFHQEEAPGESVYYTLEKDVVQHEGQQVLLSPDHDQQQDKHHQLGLESCFSDLFTPEPYWHLVTPEWLVTQQSFFWEQSVPEYITSLFTPPPRCA